MNFRSDIQGLRAFAVLVVVLFHCGFSVVSGGFIGVDVFFVLSGFLITSLLMKELSTGSFSLAEFYAKRIRRLYPALIAIVILTLLFGYFIFMPDEFLELGQSTASLVFYASNIFFWLKSDYFDGPSELKPLLHSWSLSVEEQFYLIFPLLLLALYRLRLKPREIAITFGILSLISLGTCQWLMPYEGSAAFFLTPFRMWEFMLGASCVFVPSTWKDTKTAGLLSLFGIFLLIASLLIINKTTSFPGLTALPVCFGTAMIITFNNKNTLAHKLLSYRPLLFIGKISYSTYLFHWPLVVFYSYYQMRDLYVYEKYGLALASFIGGYVIYLHVENRLRVKILSAKQIRQTFAYTLVLTLALAGVGLSVHVNNGFPSRFEIASIEKLEKPLDYPQIGKCFLHSEDSFSNWSKESCFIGTHDNQSSTILVWGDSHVNHLIYGLARHKSEVNKNLLVYANAGCAPIINENPVNRPNCSANNKFILDHLSTLNVSHIVLAANWQFASSSGVSLSKLESTIISIKNMGLTVSIINQLPIYPISNPLYLVNRLHKSDEFSGDWFIKPSRGFKERRIIAKIAQATNTPVYDSFNAFCNKDGECQILRNDMLMVNDVAHLSFEGSEYFISNILKDDKRIFRQP